MTTTILLTGFEPFGGESSNPSWEIAHALDGWTCEGRTVRAVRLPCAFGDAVRTLDDALAAHTPELVVCLGQAGSRAEISLERVAINVDDARIPDNLGRQPVDAPIVAGGPAAYFSTLPIKAMARDVRAAGGAAAVSNTAGTFVCNHVFYALMHRLATTPALAHARGGFVHVPYTPDQVATKPGTPSMPLSAQIEGIRHALRSALLTRTDVRETAGREH
ncbi:pyroglutamyl-peptidase I [Scleromatobacter humisilvae]|uniref:Pyrrolidone-carboxylate peptidase n=1 Tax=Scleromatobacter humisilvae TaxID=2897159 RepID=A0A9X1YLF9_9BURK|nr:pyroglutamyl-peptidase I [Scleromatobacter humisilvae]MCK9687630.1 pyroglutamyl-peptidase I [Scleromatobacter humisilvae]